MLNSFGPKNAAPPLYLKKNSVNPMIWSFRKIKLYAENCFLPKKKRAVSLLQFSLIWKNAAKPYHFFFNFSLEPARCGNEWPCRQQLLLKDSILAESLNLAQPFYYVQSSGQLAKNAIVHFFSIYQVAINSHRRKNTAFKMKQFKTIILLYFLFWKKCFLADSRKKQEFDLFTSNLISRQPPFDGMLEWDWSLESLHEP